MKVLGQGCHLGKKDPSCRDKVRSEQVLALERIGGQRAVVTRQGATDVFSSKCDRRGERKAKAQAVVKDKRKKPVICFTFLG